MSWECGGISLHRGGEYKSSMNDDDDDPNNKQTKILRGTKAELRRRYRIDTTTVEMIHQQDWPSEEDCEEWVTLLDIVRPATLSYQEG